MNISALMAKLIPFRVCRKSKCRSKQKYHTSTQSKRHRSSSFSRVNAQERETILELRDEGLTIEQIAEELGRSTKTIHKVLREHGANEKQGPGGKVRSESENRNSGTWLDSIRESLHKKIEPVIAEKAESLLERRPELMKDLIYNSLDLRPPKTTLDDVVKAEILDTPEFRRRFAIHYMEEIERGGRTEMDILKEGLALIFSVAEQFQKGEWARVVQSLINSGELRKTITEAAASIQGNKPPVAADSQVDQKKAEELKNPVLQVPSLSATVAEILSNIHEGLGSGLFLPSQDSAAPNSNGADPANGDSNG